MKYGLIYYQYTSNLGDDILSYAGKRFLPHVDYYIDRENMDLFVPKEKEYVAAILNGWYLHYSYTFPPSPYLLPLFVGAHFNQDATLFGDYSYLDGYAAYYLNRYKPIGCRDKQTMQVLRQKGIESYFSGCLTLTLQKYQDVKSNHTIFLTDIPENVTEYVKNRLPGKKIVSLTHRLTAEECGWDSWEKREERVEMFLKRYQGADLVITTRLHCALPCIALGTPVVLVVNRNEDYYDRLDCFSQYCSSFSEEEILCGKGDEALSVSVQNQKPEMLIRQMQNVVWDFMADVPKRCLDTSLLPELPIYQELYIRRSENMRRAVRVLLQQQDALTRQYMQNMERANHIIERARQLLDTCS